MILKQFEGCEKMILPRDIREKEITVPRTPNRSIVVKFLKNCFFLTWKLKWNYKNYYTEEITYI
jgi:hypothetical protein